MLLLLSLSAIICVQGLLTALKFPGSHHLHLDPGDSEPVKHTIMEFLTAAYGGFSAQSSASGMASGVESTTPS
jgi:hypothetical protein